MKRIAPLLAALLLAGCATTQPATLSVPFDDAEFARQMAPGTAKIVGQAFLKTAGGDVKYGAGNEVLLFPANAYTIESRRLAMDGTYTEKDPRFTKYIRKTVADGNGNFEFSGLAAGRYFLECHIVWQYAAGQFLANTGGYAKGDVTVKDGETVKVIVTK